MSDAKITCSECGAQVHAIQLHLRDSHPNMTVEEYSAKYPDAPLLSDMAKRKIAERQAAKVEPAETKVDMATEQPASVSVLIPMNGVIKKPFNEVFTWVA